jgi:hypothetical protein
LGFGKASKESVFGIEKTLLPHQIKQTYSLEEEGSLAFCIPSINSIP